MNWVGWALTGRARSAGALAALAAVLALPPAAGAAGVAPYGQDDYGGFHDVLPPGRGRPTAVRACDRPLLVPARGTERWALHVPRRLARGRYRVSVRALDASGDVARAGAVTVRVR